MELLVGSYTSGSNRGQGISAVPIGEDGLLGRPRLLAEVPDPSFLALADDGVYAVFGAWSGPGGDLRARCP
jgi:6-phosphogluconolactonase